ncbi:MAG: 30S ribosomal protein S7 [Candidatus Yanofskybacteria bacterium RIFCSPHIGHO2_01_FULL_43_42]|uniref:Small ribosomal subunit protein uS7 n=1 Tax=Candidatus Yanofskybacteria bacterium RIFCSPLOWO2_01_FULL_43_22 TaxID=1802695 RepID=A0A1F8GE96_9BACT|nr:MAG: 30S ribosomal protein S7 [Candidatus Yanofskybacteria bacterium RIFCSPHIGHO2_01_FULL_43_42]OGN12565.1 MAG: 30S ribosomal protein S7 [Candidatus Yanofskybacteria bacterium RIFCSPHIGHO2_02_FULL_43_17]OGN23712.1 MAG: 30S ribosomal protein S7 [Candidatus Yanofskybacteria bacterium RIFCSPLOWO2_01_FULL_43_22]
MRRLIKKRAVIDPDVRYSNVLVAKFINKIMEAGKKSVARKIVYSALELAEKQTKKPAIEVFEKAMENVSPTVELRSRRMGGANYQVPVEVRPERRTALAIRWIVESARAQKGKPMAARLAEEFVNAFNNAGGAIKKKQDVHRMAEANKAFAHFSW